LKRRSNSCEKSRNPLETATTIVGSWPPATQVERGRAALSAIALCELRRTKQ
jgi:hypothetical protein